ncbi:MAG: glycosyl transferase family 1 [Proteobacteria bacterium]|nr:glycosyl transferase family 1 [Pseudomonadota bacterium]
MTLRVLQVYRTYYPECRGGLLEVIRQICIGGRPLGVENHIFALSRHPETAVKESDGIEVRWFRQDFELAGCGFSWDGLRRFKELAAWADVVHYHFPWPFADLLHLLGRPKRPTVLTYHSDIVKQERLMYLYGPVMRRFLASVDAIVATSPNYLATSPVLQAFSAKTHVIPIGIDAESYPPVKPENLKRWRDRLGEGYFLFVGVIRYYKGLQFLLEAIRGTSHKVAILGGGPILGELKSFAQSHGMDNVVFLGELPDEDKVALLKLCRGLLLPSHLRSEAFGVSLLEAAMFAKPLVTCEIGTGTSFVNVHEQTGLVVPPQDPIALRQALDRLAGSPESCQRFGDEAYRRYQERFTARRMAESYLALYREITESCAE